MKSVLKKFTKHDLEITFRYPTLGDASKMLDYVNELSNEKTFITLQGEQMTLDEEVAYLHTLLELIKNKEGSSILAFDNDKLVGMADMRLRKRVFDHSGEIALAVSKSYRNKGVGALLLDVLINDSIEHFPNLEILTLQVFANNTSAIKLYENFGFTVFGKLPKGVQYRGTYVDEILMYKTLKE